MAAARHEREDHADGSRHDRARAGRAGHRQRSGDDAAAVSHGERIERRGAGVLRTITRAALFELSAVTRPAYSQAQIEARAWQAGVEPIDAGLQRTLNRWRL